MLRRKNQELNERLFNLKYCEGEPKNVHTEYVGAHDRFLECSSYEAGALFVNFMNPEKPKVIEKPKDV